MKRRDMLRAAALTPLLAAARATGQAPEARSPKPEAAFPGEEKLTRAKRDATEAMAKVRLQNSDPPDLMPRVRRRK
jgi:hypothetical protein